jgi:Flp pilus assembly protein TadG
MIGSGKTRRAFAGANGGAAAVEFAIVLPLLVGLVVGVVQYGVEIIANQQMHNGVASAAMYIMRGGSGVSSIQNVAMGAWPNPPSDAAVSVTQACQCNGAGAACGALCADQSYPQSFTTITATGTYVGIFGSQAMSASQVVRTQ